MSDAEQSPSAAADTISILDLVQVLAKRKWLVLGVTAVVGAITLGYVALTISLPPDSRWNRLPNIYRPEVRVLLLDRAASSAVSGALRAANGSLGGIAGLLGVPTTVNSSAALAEALLTGRTIHDQIAQELGFLTRYGLSGTDAKVRARDRVANSLQYEYDVESNIMTVAYEDIDPEFATVVLRRVVVVLSRRFQELTMETIRRKKAFLEDRLLEVNAERRAAQDVLVEFQRKYGIVDLESQSRQTLALIAQYRQDRLAQELEMQRLLEYLSTNHAGVVQVRNRIVLLDQLITQLESGGQRFRSGSIPQEELPGLAVEYLNLRGELELHAGIYGLLRQQYETTRIEETDTSQTFQMVENAEVPLQKYAPSRTRVVIVVVVAAFFVAVLLAFGAEYLERAKADSQQARKLAYIRAQFRRRPKTSSA